ncbi:MAG: hypothetical protein KJ052_09780 [Candidatus Hydrogenedentes bacterium]|nr:hypothetical protein [Candidatus Hydrogenedentota bacterium]
MLRKRTVWLLSLVLALTGYAQTAGAPEQSPFVVVCELEGMVDEGMAVVVERAVRDAADAEAIIFVVDTFGGRVDSAITISNAIMEAPCRTIAFIRGKGAISAGALISFSCDDIVMASGTNIGAAEPRYFGMGESQAVGEKETSFLRSKFAAVAEANGHNPAIAVAMVDKSIELRARPNEGGRLTVYSPNMAGSAPTSAKSEGSELDEVIDDAFEQMQGDSIIPLEPMKDAVKEVVRQLAEAKDPGEDSGLDQEPAADGSYLVLPEDRLLTLTPKEAFAYGVIETTTDSINQVMGLYELQDHRRVDVVMTWEERAFRWLTDPTVSGILLMLGIGGLYLEIKTPGIGIPGAIGIVCLTLFFGSRMVLGLSSWIDIVLVIIGLGFIAVEMFVIPGFGIAGVVGILCVSAGLILSFTLNDWTIPRYSWEFDRLKDAGLTFSITSILLVIFIFAAWKLLPHTPVYNKLVLSTSQTVDQGYTVQDSDASAAWIGKQGVAVSNLRPSGRGRIDGKSLQVVSQAEFIDKGAPIVIVQVDGNRYVVDAVKTKEEA